MTKDFTEGVPIKLIMFFTIPYLIGNLFQQFYNIADTIIVGRTLGMNALAAVGSTGSIVGFTLFSAQGLTTGLAAVLAQRFGANDTEGIKKSFTMSILISSVFTAIYMIVFITFSYNFLEFLNTPKEIINDAHKYATWIFIGFFATMLYNLLSNMIRALGDSKTPLIFLVVSCLINITLDLVFIVYFKMGPEGAGLATFIAQFISGILCIIYIIKKLPVLHFSIRHIKYDNIMVSQLLKVSLPMTFLNMVISAGSIIISFVNNSLGTLYVASYTAASKVEQILIQPLMSFGSAQTVFAAQNYGAKKYDRIKKGASQTLIVTLIWAALSTIIILLFGKIILSAVAGAYNTELIRNGYNFLIINCLLSVFLAALIIYKSILQAVGRGVIPVISGIIEVFCRAGASLWLASKFGFIGICFANPTAWIGALIIIVIDYFFLLKDFKKLTVDNAKNNPLNNFSC